MSPAPGRDAIDAVVIGTSPILMIEALMRARAGQQVRLIEDGPRGGAWQLTQLDEIERVEGACHLMDNSPGAYEFLESVLGIRMRVVDPPPELLKADGRRIAIGSRGYEILEALSLAMRIPIAAIIRLAERASAGRFQVRRARNFRFSQAIETLSTFFRQPIRYPIGGSPAMLDRLEGELRSHGAVFVPARVERLTLLAGACPSVELDDGSKLAARQVVAAESSMLRILETDGRKTEFVCRELGHLHLIVEASGLERPPFSYLHLHGDRRVVRASDVTDYCRHPNRKPGVRVLVIELSGRGARDSEPELSTLMAHLEQRGVLPSGVEVLRHRLTQIITRVAEPPVAASLRALARDDIVVLRSHGGLSIAVSRNRARWLAILGRDGVHAHS
jgi:hypothetical protein